MLGAAAVGVLYVLLRIVDVRPVVAAASAVVFAFSGTFWSQAVVAEVYTLHVLFLVTVTACLAHWRTGAANGWLLAGLGLYALSFGNHLPSIVALPGVAWIVWSDRRRALRWGNAARGRRRAARAGQYLYLVHLSDAAPYREAQIDSLGDVAGYVTGGDFKDAMFAFGPRALLVDRVPLVLDYLGLEYGVLLVPMAAGIVRGLWRLPAAPRGRGRPAGAARRRHGGLCPQLRRARPGRLLPAAVLPAGGVPRHRPGGRRPLARGPPVGVAVGAAGRAGALAVLVVLFAAGNRSGSSQRGEVAVAEQTERAIDAAGSDAVLLTDDYNDSEYLWYYLLGEGLGEERNLVVADQVTPGEVADYFVRLGAGGRGGREPARPRTGALHGRGARPATSPSRASP